ncbi:MAG: discoidin domain-containing protein, partial [Angustibacter sp.]
MARKPRRAMVTGLCLALTCFGTAALPPAAQAAERLLSQGRPTTASTVEGPGTPASAAVDGSLGSRWSSAFADNQWLRIDLGATAAIS